MTNATAKRLFQRNKSVHGLSCFLGSARLRPQQKRLNY